MEVIRDDFHVAANDASLLMAKAKENLRAAGGDKTKAPLSNLTKALSDNANTRKQIAEASGVSEGTVREERLHQRKTTHEDHPGSTQRPRCDSEYVRRIGSADRLRRRLTRW